MQIQKGLVTRIGEWLDDKKVINHNSRQGSKWLPTPGNIIFTLVMVALLILTQRTWASSSQSANTPGPSATTINYQGRLADDAGNPQTGTLGMSFAIWDAANGGGIIWGSESHSAIPVTDGLFNVGLGSQTSGGIPTTVWNGDRYLEITVSGETLTPRELIRSVPIAGMALTVPDETIVNSNLAPNVIPVYSTKSTEHAWVIPQCDATKHLIPGLTLNFTVDKPSTALVDFSGIGYNAESGKAIYSNIWVDGVNKSFLGGCRNSGVDAGSPFCSLNNMITQQISSGQHTIEVRAHCDGDGLAKVWDGNMRIVILP